MRKPDEEEKAHFLNRQRVLAEWRRYWEPRDIKKNTHTLREVMPGAMKELGLEKRYAEEEMLMAWSEIVGPFIASHSKPVKMDRNVLLIRVLQPAIRYTLERDLKGQILAKLRERFGEKRVKDLRFVL